MFRDYVNRYATPFTTGLFVVSLVSGIALFFHVGQTAFRGMHEWLSMVLIVPFVLHVWKNWLPILSYLKRGWLIWPLAACLVAGLAFAVPAMTGSASSGGNPMMALARTVGDARLADLAPVLKTTPQELQTKLEKAGLPGVAPDTSINAAAKAAGKDGRAIVFAVVSAK